MDMLLADVLTSSGRYLLRTRIRVLVSVSVMALGISGLITVFSLGDALEKVIGSDLELVGRAVILQASWDFSRVVRWHHGEFFREDMEQVKRLPGVVAVSPFLVRSDLWTFFRGRKASCKIIGVKDNFFATCDLTLARGRRITEDDVSTLAPVCVLGPCVADELFAPTEPALGSSILIEGASLKVAGILGGLEHPEFQYCVIVPFSVARTSIRDMTEIRDFYVRADSWDDVERVREQVLEILRSRQPEYGDAIEVIHYPEHVKNLKNSVFHVKILLWGAIGVVLLLASMEIVSFMIASVQERTGEIGIRRAVGATERAIFQQFLAEAVAVSVTGAVQGVMLGSISVEVFKRILLVEPRFHMVLLGCLLGLAVGGLAGLLAGTLPALKASRLAVSEAMRFE
jgi:putative ABC transport system permease protein